jgi:hypothetical protein
MTTVNGTPLPATDTNAELLALGAALNTPGDLADILALPTDAFEPGRNRTVHAALVAVTRQGLPATPQTVYAELDRNGHHDTAVFVFSLYQNGVPGTGHHFAQKIAGAARSRDYLAAAQRLTQLATTEPGEERDAYVLDVAAGLFENLADTGTPDIQALKHDREVQAEVRRLRARGDAARAYAREQRGDHATPPVITLGNEFLAQPDPATTYRIDRLWPTGGRVLLAAQYKAGKTTMMGNLIRSLVDAQPFLDHYHINRQARRVTLIDNELDPHMIRRWLREQHITRTDAFAVLPLRGHLSTFDLLDPHTRSHWATQLRDLGTDIVILDCLRPIMDALGLDENREAGRLLTAIDELLGEAQVAEAVIVHHMGHTGERSRGDSRLRDWPDVEWRLMREDLDDPASPRYFAAFGRDVDIPETRHLTAATGSRKDAAAHRGLDGLLDLLAADDARQGLSTRQIIQRALENDVAAKHVVPKILTLAVNQGHLTSWTGPRRAAMYALKPTTTAPHTPTPDPPPTLPIE